MLTPTAGFFVEYRSSVFQFDDRFTNERIVHGMKLGRTNGSATFNIDSVVAGVSFRY